MTNPQAKCGESVPSGGSLGAHTALRGASLGLSFGGSFPTLIFEFAIVAFTLFIGVRVMSHTSPREQCEGTLGIFRGYPEVEKTRVRSPQGFAANDFPKSLELTHTKD